MANPTRILSTKVLLSHQKQVLTDVGLEVLEYNFIQVETKNFELKGIKDHLIFTSQNAVRSFLNHPQFEKNKSGLQSKKAFCVGVKSKTILTDAGFEVVAYADYASDLAEIVSLIYADGSYTFFTGNLRKETMPLALKEAGIAFNEIEVYETKLTPKKITESIDAILFFSPSGVESYLKDNKIKKEMCFCIGETTAEALEKVTKNSIVAQHPSIEALLDDVIEELK
ncbi:uroporphyrinogen III synthase [Flavobacterium branchiophilum NBRC 15030 = ATCC 35035]|uniref:Uroporphyrinogen-III synthase n=1 Tax=Flavobacterium branchiophilum TaxID=55197 RepID=A0A543G382_9FLAO|nr:uroporphyrinogen-III synthase [Flavobacterium branchiophilum]OXA76267.1 uroporphyrinogen III synthase [Flavobacterium branchiophilum NBRC 15030 = ATCC 35035]TQM40517.1 uroporphyrinogen-III synthase [Flavobacterium branchiophilum]GEM55092.1 uroporphyrinogen III methyltransferase [Flavobacterium branchiophilum NBRC 15030 = ATCC 35035]